MDSDDPSAVDAAERKVEDSRERLDRHLDELSETLAPASLAASALEKINPVNRLKGTLMDRPVLATLLTAVAGVVALRQWRRKTANERQRSHH